jgi:hypothetical protein
MERNRSRERRAKARRGRLEAEAGAALNAEQATARAEKKTKGVREGPATQGTFSVPPSRFVQKNPEKILKMPERLDKDEACQILEELARTGPPSAQVEAIRVLLRLDKESEEEWQPDAFDALDPPKSRRAAGRTEKVKREPLERARPVLLEREGRRRSSLSQPCDAD